MMLKKCFTATAMLLFIGLGASQLVAKNQPVQNLRECTTSEEGQCLWAYRSSALNTCVKTWGRIVCFYDDGTQKIIYTN